MEHNEILNPNEGKTVDNIVWPFYRYSALIPKQIGADLFVWLYLSLVILQNQQKGLQKDNYTDEVKKEVENKNYFCACGTCSARCGFMPF